jgi:UDP-N-acetylglucosamine pyrophosphorylase
VTVVQQGQGVPALLDNDAKIAAKSKDHWYEIITKPHGHGDIHQLLYARGVAKKWSALGIDWLVLFQDTNGLAFHTLPVMLGVSAGLDLIMNSLTIPRKAKQAVGGIALLTNTKTGEKRYGAICECCCWRTCSILFCKITQTVSVAMMTNQNITTSLLNIRDDNCFS